jgi:hypothetical protein
MFSGGVIGPSSRTFRLRCFERADHCFSVFVKFVTALHEGVWLGSLSADELNAITASHFAASQFYKSTEHNLSGFLPWETPLLERYFPKGSRILVAGAGAGREIFALRKNGYEAEGFECSVPLIRAGQEIFNGLGERCPIIHCAPDTVPSGPPTYNALIVGWGSYTHIPTRARRVSFLQALRQRSTPGSPLLVSFFTRNAHSASNSIVHRTATAARFLLRGRRQAIEAGDRLEWSRYVHRFTRQELEAELEDAGFSIEYYGQSTDSSAHAVALTK